MSAGPLAARSPLNPGSSTLTAARRERTGVLGAAAIVLVAIACYVAVSRFESGINPEQNLLPYQTLARTLPQDEQALFRALEQALPGAEAVRARTARWPDTSALARDGVPPFAGESNDAPPYRWERFEERQVIDYLGIPREPSAPAWLLMIQEPAAGALPDQAPNDEEHQRLPDGTVLHVYVWMHRFGGRLAARFAPEPQANGWTQVLTAPLPVRR